MSIKKANLKDVEVMNLEGRDLQWLVTKDTIGAEKLSALYMVCKPYQVVRPVHVHKDIEEVLFILQGKGEVWIDGEYDTFEKGDVVMLPANSKHQVRNISDEDLICYNIFSASTNPSEYIIYDEDAFEGR